LAHLSADEALTEAFRKGKDIHAQTASQIFGVPPETVSPEMRKAAKAINFGIIYGMGAFSLSKDIGVSVATAKEYIENYFATYPKIKGYLDSLICEGRTNGFVSTYFGRRRYVPELSVTKKNLVAFGERIAMNTPIQGTAADIIKLAMVNVDRRLEKEGLRTRLILQVHDELILEAPREESERVAKLLKEEMEKAVKLRVALVADTQVGDNWFDCH
jgi:DNA polymerase-1